VPPKVRSGMQHSGTMEKLHVSIERSTVGEEMMRRVAQLIGIVSYVVSGLPFVALAGLCGAAAYIRSYFGRWPVVYRDSVNAPFEGLAVSVTNRIVLAVVPLLLAALLIALVRWAGRVRPVLGIWASVFVVGWVLVFGLVWLDPVGFVTWSMD
jgi:hypothetical protein